jgi:hypothetical protein
MYKVYLRDAKRGFQISRVVTLTKKQDALIRPTQVCRLGLTWRKCSNEGQASERKVRNAIMYETRRC